MASEVEFSDIKMFVRVEWHLDDITSRSGLHAHAIVCVRSPPSCIIVIENASHNCGCYTRTR